ncbi:MAG TPA: hypothetical protein VFA11_05430 [Acidimicrobiales bacterium]|nr:hypothetical protein [Acidimicrobiales bacterium]
MEAVQARPVFVDETGRRRRRAARAGRTLAVLIVAYLVLLGISFARPPWAPRLSLPGVGTVLGPAGQHRPPSLGPSAKVSPLPNLNPAAPAPPAPAPAPAPSTTAPRPRIGASTAPTTTVTTSASTSTTTGATTTSVPGHRHSTTTTSSTSTTTPGRKP